MKRMIIALTLLPVLFGCTTAPKIEERVVYKTVQVSPPAEMLEYCEIPKPPSIKEYLALPDFDKKEEFLINWMSKSIQSAKTCRVQQQTLKEWVQGSKKINK